ncbi:MAG: glycosyltransferase family 2 protein [Candidatus Binatia bacterium]
MPALTAIVLHWGDPALTRRCLARLLAAAPADVEVLVVDGVSAVDWSAEAGGRVRVLRAPGNEGYAGGNNRGLRAALAAGAEYALLLNNDALIAPDALDHLRACAAGDPRIALVGCRLVAPDDPARDVGSHGRITYGPFLVAIDAGQATAGDVEWVSGCGVLVRLAALADVGLLDESFFLYCEDVDWCLRARRRGYRVVYEPRAVVVHGPAASPAARSRRAYFLARNGLLFARKHGTWRERAKLSAAALALPLASLLRRLAAGEPLAPAAWVARGVVDGFLGRPPRLRQLGLR